MNGTPFEVQNYRIEESLTMWMDGDGGVAFRGTLANGEALDMSCGTFPIDDSTGRIALNEPSDLMSASSHPTWNTIDEPDLAFFRSMGYELK